MRVKYIHSYETHKVDSVSDLSGTRILKIGKRQVEVHPECKLIAGDTLDIFTANDLQKALAQQVATVLIHSNPLAKCEACPFLGKGCKSGAADALEDLGGFKGFKTEI